jgi:transposase
MMLIGVDYHPSFQTIAFFIEETGECGEQELNHSDGEAERFYRELQSRGIRVRGMEATGYSRWFERLLQGVKLIRTRSAAYNSPASSLLFFE